MSSTTTDDAATGPNEAAGLGRMLRAAREAQGLMPAELARQLNLDVHLITALEQEDLAALPAPVYVRGYLRRLAINLALDEEALLRAHQRLVGRIESPPLRSTPPIETMKSAHDGSRRQRWLAVGFVAAVAALGLFGTTLLREPWLQGDAASTPPAPEPAAPLSVAPSIPLAIEPPPAPAPATTGDTPPATPVVGEVVAPVQTPTATEPTPPPGLELRTGKGESWVQVKDATGKVLFEGVLKAGTSRQVDGMRPFQVVIGRAEAVTLSLDGKPVDLRPHARPNGKAFIARLGG